MPKILMLLQSEFPPDIRLEKEIKSLSDNGFNIYLLCNQYDKNNSKEFPGCKIIRINAIFNNHRLNKIINFPLFLNPRFIYYVLKTFLKTQPNFVHAHDLPMVPLALLVKMIFKTPVIFDMHENYPEALKAFEKKGMLNILFKNYRLAKILEKFCITHSDMIISVVEENKNRLEDIGVDNDKLYVVSNTVQLSSFNMELTKKINLDEYMGKYIILYTGTVSPERGLFTPLKAINTLRTKIPEIFILIIGDGPSVIPLQTYIDNSSINDYVKLIPWVGHHKIINYINRANICIIPQPSNNFIDTTIPHKLFEYMSLGKPILTSNAKSLKRIVNETNCGLVFNSEDPDDFAKKILKLSKSETDYGENGRNAVIKTYNWEYDSKKLLEVYQNLT